MKEQLLTYKNRILETWNSFSNVQKILIIGAILFLIISIVLMTNWASQPDFVSIYSNLTPAEAGEIVTEIESKGVPVQISGDGTSIEVPKAEASKLKVELAHAGIPRSGNINYGVFSENMGFGMTDKQFDVVERDAMQSELRYLIEQIDGVQQAKVMITLPKESIWVSDGEKGASASVVISTGPGFALNQPQINGFYHLISKSVPNLSTDDIVIMNQNWQTLELVDESTTDSTTLSVHQQQQEVKKDIERDIQRQLQQMLGTILGMDKVIVSVFANVDFTKQKTEQDIVEPVDEESNEGIAISVERIQESYSGQGGSGSGVPGTGEADIPGYTGSDDAQNSEYERIEERINREVNRIHREIVSSPYTVNDLTIQVGVEPPIPNDPASLTDENVNDIKSILKGVIRTSLSASNQTMTEEVLDQKITVFANEFRGRPVLTETTEAGIPSIILYGLAAVAALAIGAVAFSLVRRVRKKEAVDNAVPDTTPEIEDPPDNEATKKRKHLERMAKNKPEEFAKLLKTWLAED